MKYNDVFFRVSFLIVICVIGGIAAPVSAGVWHNTTVDSGNVGKYTSLAFGTSGPCISYFDGAGCLKYAWYESGVWHNEVVDSAGTIVGYYTSLAIDPSGNPCISYYDNFPNYDLKYAWQEGGVWHNETVESAGIVGSYNSLAFDETGNPCISYCDETLHVLKYVRKESGAWFNETVDSGDVGKFSSLAFDSLGNPCISYFDESNDNLKYAWYDGSAWRNENVDSAVRAGEYSSLAFDASGNPCISYYNAGTSDLRYACKEGDSWRIETPDSPENVGAYTSLAFDASNIPHISYFDATNGNLKHAWLEAGEWHNETVDDAQPTGYYTSISFDISDNPCISYYDPAGDLRYAWLVPTGDISVTSVPDGAWIYLDGVNQSVRTNTTLADLTTGTYEIGVHRQGYSIPANVSVAVTEGGTSSVHFILSPPAGNVSVLSSPEGAWIYLDGNNQTVSTNTTLTGLAPAMYNISVHRDGYEIPQNTSILITDGCEEEVFFGLRRLSGNISVSSVPDGAWIFLNGENRTVQTNTTLEDLPVDTYNVSVQRQGYEISANRSVSVTDGATSIVPCFTLILYPGGISVSSVPDGAWIHLDGENRTVLTNTTLGGLYPGEYEVTLFKNGYLTPESKDVTVNAGDIADAVFILTPQPPAADFSAAPLSGSAPLAVEFTDESTGVIETWSWDFGDGKISADRQPVHTYTSAGTYDVSLSVANSGGGNSTLRTGLIRVRDSSTGSGDGGRSSADADAVHDIPAAGEAVFHFDSPASCIYAVRVTAGNNSITDMLITLDGRSSPPQCTGRPGTDVYEYADITLYKTTGDAITGASIWFRISAADLEAKGWDPLDVVMLRSHDNAWQMLETHLVAGNGTRYDYRASSPGLSTFAIAYGKAQAFNDLPVPLLPEQTAELPDKATLPASVVQTQEEPDQLPARQSPLTSAVAVLAFFALCSGSLLWRR